MIFRMIKNKIKYIVAKVWFEKVASQFKPDCGEDFRQKWIHLQGQILTKGKMRWNWGKLIGKGNKRNNGNSNKSDRKITN